MSRAYGLSGSPLGKAAARGDAVPLPVPFRLGLEAREPGADRETALSIPVSLRKRPEEPGREPVPVLRFD